MTTPTPPAPKPAEPLSPFSPASDWRKLFRSLNTEDLRPRLVKLNLQMKTCYLERARWADVRLWLLEEIAERVEGLLSENAILRRENAALEALQEKTKNGFAAAMKTLDELQMKGVSA